MSNTIEKPGKNRNHAKRAKRAKRTKVYPMPTDILRSPSDPSIEARMAIARAVDNAHAGGRIYLPEDISPQLGLDPKLAQALAESFPAPNPDIVRARRLRMAAGANTSGYYAVIVCIPRDVMMVTGMRLGDCVLMSGWSEGVIRIVRVPEGPQR